MTEKQIRANYQTIAKPYHKLGLSVAGDVSWLVWLDKAEKRIQRFNERSCNDEITERGERRHERFCDEVVEAIEAALPAAAGCVYINGDPRGAAIKLTPYVDDESHDTRHGCDANPKYAQLIHDSGIQRDWGGYGMLAPQHQ